MASSAVATPEAGAPEVVTSPAAIPIKYEFRGSLRRAAVDVPPRLDQLCQKLAESFPQFTRLIHDGGSSRSGDLRLSYTDDEGDEITITTDDELAAAHALANEAGKVLRLAVQADASGVDSSADGSSSNSNNNNDDDDDSSNSNSSNGDGGDSDSVGQNHAQPQNHTQEQEQQRQTPQPQRQGVARAAARPALAQHFGVTCDATGQCPIAGPRFHKRGHNFDLCEAAFHALPAAEQALYDRVNYPRKIVDWDRSSTTTTTTTTTSTTRPASAANDHTEAKAKMGVGMMSAKPIPSATAGIRQATAGARVDTSPSTGSPAAVHHGITCDASGMSPIVGPRFWKRAENFDLCEAEFSKLPSSERAAFVRIDNPHGCTARAARGCAFGRKIMAAVCRAARGHCPLQQPPQPSQPWPQCPWRRCCPLQQRVVTFVGDVSLPDGAVVEPGARVVKTWRLRAPAGLPAGTMLTFVCGARLGAPARVPVRADGRATPPGELEVSVALHVPSTPSALPSPPSSEPERLRGFWRLEEGGRCFGPRVWVDVCVGSRGTQRCDDAPVARAEAAPDIDQAKAGERHQPYHHQREYWAARALQVVDKLQRAQQQQEQQRQQHAQRHAQEHAQLQHQHQHQQQPPQRQRPEVLRKMLAGIAKAPAAERSVLSDLCHRALLSGDCSSVAAKLATLNISVE